MPSFPQSVVVCTCHRYCYIIYLDKLEESFDECASLRSCFIEDGRALGRDMTRREMHSIHCGRAKRLASTEIISSDEQTATYQRHSTSNAHQQRCMDKPPFPWR